MDKDRLQGTQLNSFMGTLSIPAKTFVGGEYLALINGPALVMTHGPLFELKFAFSPNQKANSSMGLPSGSPADVLLLRHHNQEIVKHLNVEFIDPFQGLGGMGASTAQFASVWILLNESLVADGVVKENSISRALLDYREICSLLGNTQTPSGADLVAQMTGLVRIHDYGSETKRLIDFTFIDGKNRTISKINWNFSRLYFRVIHTGVKLATHQHLQTLQLNDIKSQLAKTEKIVLDLYAGLAERDDMKFLCAIRSFDFALKTMGLRAKHTLELQAELEEDFGDQIVSKGCGAMGSDTLLVCGDFVQMQKLDRWISDKGLRVVAKSQGG